MPSTSSHWPETEKKIQIKCIAAIFNGIDTHIFKRRREPVRTGFAVSPRGYLVTCYHVIHEAERIVVCSLNAALPLRLPPSTLATISLS